MYVWGTVNPEGESDEHTGILLRQRDIDDLASTDALVDKPVKIEHAGASVGRVVHAWRHGERLDCLLELNDRTADGLFARSFVRMGKTPELSLGYSVTMCQSADDGLVRGGKKEVLEVSLVRKGARHNCHIRGFDAPRTPQKTKGEKEEEDGPPPPEKRRKTAAAAAALT